MELISEIKHFEVDSTQSNKYVIVDPYPLNQDDIDVKAVTRLTRTRFNDVKKYTLDFLNHHYNYSNDKKSFVKHIRKLLKESRCYFDEFPIKNKGVDKYFQLWLDQTASLSHPSA